MTLTRTLAAFLMAGVLIQGSYQDCLTSAQLSALGFNASASATTSSSVCSDLYANNGGCVDPAQMNTFFSVNQANLQANANATLSLASVLDNAATQIENFAKTVQNAAASSGVTLSAADEANIVAQMRAMISNARSSTNACYQSYQNLVNGLYCYLTSNRATNNTVLVTNGVNLGVAVGVDLNSTGNALSACLPLIDTYCAITYGVSISSNASNSFLTASAYLASSGNTNIPMSTCTGLQSVYNCTTSDCKAAINAELITQVFNPALVTFAQSSTYLNNQNQFFANLANATASISTSTTTKSRRLQAPSNSNSAVATAPSNGGEDINSHGQKSGAPTTNYGSAALLAALSSLLFALIYA